MRDEQRYQAAGQSRDDGRGGKADPEIGDELELAEPERIGADPEIGAMTERWQSGRAQHQIEGKRVERPDQDLDAEIGIKPDARDP